MPNTAKPKVLELITYDHKLMIYIIFNGIYSSCRGIYDSLKRSFHQLVTKIPFQWIPCHMLACKLTADEHWGVMFFTSNKGQSTLQRKRRCRWVTAQPLAAQTHRVANLFRVMASAQLWQKQAACDNSSWVDREAVNVADALRENNRPLPSVEHLNTSAHTTAYTTTWRTHTDHSSTTTQASHSLAVRKRTVCNAGSCLSSCWVGCTPSVPATCCDGAPGDCRHSESLRLRSVKAEPLYLNTEACFYKMHQFFNSSVVIGMMSAHFLLNAM